MKASVRWLNQLVGGGGELSADRVESMLTDAGFPIDGREAVPGGDTRLEVEVTSNRGDCLSHIGLAREIAARDPSRSLQPPSVPTVKSGTAASGALRLLNDIPKSCPRFTAQVIKGIKIGPSPKWLVACLDSVGQRPINNIVDATNYINFLYGQPTHAFDLIKLAGKTLIVRMARDGEPLTTLDGKKRTLKSDEMVVADERSAQSLAGVIGGAHSEVGPDTQDLVLEAATWDPVIVRRAARRHQVRTDAGHRFERGVDPRTIDEPARLAAALIADLGGGTLCTGMLDAGPPPAALRTVTLRMDRCRALLGVAVDDSTIQSILRRLSIDVAVESPGVIRCTIPPFRLDLEREVDLIEEVARVHGLDRLPVLDRMAVAVRPPQVSEAAVTHLGHALSGLGFFETVTFSFITPRQAAPFMPAAHIPVAVADDRRAADGTLRPSTIPSLLLCRKSNADRGVTIDGGLRLFESSSVFSRVSEKPAERRTLALLLDAPGVERGKPGTPEQRQHAVRLLRGALETVAQRLGGEGRLAITPAPPQIPAFDPSAHATLSIDGKPAGVMGMLSSQSPALFGLDFPLAAAEIDLDPLLSLYPGRTRIQSLPAFPSIERDLSLIVDEAISWSDVNSLISRAAIDRLESLGFIGTYRGKQIGPGKKSLTLRMRFRDPARTLRHEEVDPQVAGVVSLARQKLGASVRT